MAMNRRGEIKFLIGLVLLACFVFSCGGGDGGGNASNNNNPPPDTTPPVITLNGAKVVTVPVGTVYNDAGATALDDSDGNITSKIVTTGLPIDTNVIGDHTVTYNVPDQAGNQAVPVTRTVNVTPVSQPPVVRVLYVTPQNRTLRSDYYAAVANAPVNIQSWYKNQLGGKTFSLFHVQPETCQLPQAADYYAVDSWAKVMTDVQTCAPVGYDDPVFVWVLYVDIVHACDAPGRLGAGTSGVTMLPRQDMDGLVGARYFDDCGQEWIYPPDRYIGGLGHELGHAFGLPHPPGCEAGLSTCDYNALMWAGFWQYPNTYLRSEEKQFLQESPFFR
jgi:Domain of unknown function (DUF5011)